MDFMLSRATRVTAQWASAPVQHAVARFWRDMEMTLSTTGFVPDNRLMICLAPALPPESYTLDVTENQLTLCAADDLGAVYGLLDISRHYLGVAPFWFWNQQQFEPKPFVTVPEGRITGPAAAVGLRGWDLSDAPWLSAWADATENGWEMIFESLLRYRGNMVRTDKQADLAAAMGLPLGRCTVGAFADGEVSISIEESVRGSDVFVVQSTCGPVNNNLMELLIMIDALKRASAGRITAVVPYYGYARQDRKAKARDPISAKLVADLISVAGADRVLSMDLHVAQIQGFFNIPVDHLMGTPILAPYFVEKFKNLPREEIAVVSPDLGSVTRARKFAERLDCPLAIIDKRRPRANVSEVMNIIGDVHGKTVVLVDDMVDTAGTLCHGAEALIKLGGAKEVYACATHGVLSGPALQRLTDSVITETVFLDTIPAKEGSEAARIKMLSVAPVFAEAISRIYEDKPVSPLFT